MAASEIVMRPDPLASAASRFAPQSFACPWGDHGVEASWMQMQGELDVATSPQLEQALSQPQGGAQLVVLDLRLLAFMSISGVRAIVDASVAARREGRRLVVIRGPISVDALFGLTGTDGEVQVLDLAADEPAVQVLLPLSRLGAVES